MQKKVIYRNGKLIEIKKVYMLYDDEGNVIRKSEYHIPFSVCTKEEKLIIDLNQIEEALL